MISVGHTGVGIIIGLGAFHFLGSGNLATGLIITGATGFTSHYLTDLIPHGHFFKPKNFKKLILPVIIFDLFLPIVSVLGIIYSQSGFSLRLLYIMFGIGGSQLPDALDGLIYSGVLKPVGFIKLEYKLHEGVHWHGLDEKTLPLGFRDIWQLMVILISLLFLWNNI